VPGVDQDFIPQNVPPGAVATRGTKKT
jgi:hypothetical protein